MPILTDDKSFSAFLHALSWDDLMDIASAHFFYEYAIQVLMKQEGLYNDILLNLKNIDTDEKPEVIKNQVFISLQEAAEETIIDLLINLTPEELIISELIETTDEENRLEIISNQLKWDAENFKKTGSDY